MKKNNDYIDPEELYDDDMPLGRDDEDMEELQADIEDNLSEEIDAMEEIEQKYNDLNNNYLRLHAEFDNYRKRTVKEKADLIKSGGERVLTEIISFADDFERALSSLHDTEDKNAMLEGMELIYAKFKAFLQQHGVKEIETLGQPFDAERFEAVAAVPTQNDSQKGNVIDCIQKGYTLNDKIIRFPKVIIGE